MPCGRGKPRHPLCHQNRQPSDVDSAKARPFANRFNYARDMCHGTTLHPAAVRAAIEPGKSQKADGLTKVPTGALMKTFVSDLGLAPLTHQ